jgi:hypothetical protein
VPGIRRRAGVYYVDGAQGGGPWTTGTAAAGTADGASRREESGEGSQAACSQRAASVQPT